MSLVLIGSRALKLRIGSAMTRKPLDFDFVVSSRDEADAWIESNYNKVGGRRAYEENNGRKVIVEGDTMVEFDIATAGSSDEMLIDLVKKDGDYIETSFGLIPSLDILFAIKDSHKYKKFGNTSDHVFWKTAQDWFLMKHMGATIRPELVEFHKLREQESYMAQRHPKLNVSKDAFFKDDAIEYVYDHDTIHQSVCLFERPAYTYYMVDGEQVKCSKEKFFAVSEDIRLAGAMEEGLVLALERSLVPHGTWSPDKAFRFAYAKVCSSITSGWFRQYCYQHIPEVLKLYEKTSKNYWEKFQSDVQSGLVKPFTTPSY